MKGWKVEKWIPLGVVLNLQLAAGSKEKMNYFSDLGLDFAVIGWAQG